MKLNPTKCAFRVTAGKFLRFMISNRRIEANSEKIRAVQEMALPRTVKEVQSLARRIATLNRLVSRSAKCCLPFYQILRRSKDFQWMDECQSTFVDLKNYLSFAPLLGKPNPDEELFLYLSTSSTAMSAILVQEWDKVQRLIYYVSQTLRDAGT